LSLIRNPPVGGNSTGIFRLTRSVAEQIDHFLSKNSWEGSGL
jgi:hypothetical protein